MPRDLLQRQPKDLLSESPVSLREATQQFLSESDPAPYTPKPPQSMMDKVKGVGETAAAIGTGMTTGLLGRTSGFADQLYNELTSGGFKNPREAADRIEQASLKRQADWSYAPKTEAGQEYTKTVGEVGEALAPLAPLTAELQTLGTAVQASKPVVSSATHAMINRTHGKLVTAGAKKLLKDSAPTIEGLKAASREVYKEIDNLGAIINSSRTDRLAKELGTLIKREGFNKRIHPKVAAALDEMSSIAGKDQTVTNLDTLRRVVQGAAKSLEPDEKRLGVLMINKIDDFMDNLSSKDFRAGGGKVGAKYRDARQLWQRAKKAEMVEEAISKAKNQASGFENGLRVQFRAILNNKKKLKGFTAEEIAAMQKIVRGGKAENIAKVIGKFGFSEGQASNVLMGSLGVAGGAAVAGPPGAVAVPIIGQLSRGLAQKLTRNNANALNTIVRAGRDADKIVSAYLKSVPKKERSAADLSELLLHAKQSP